MSYFPELDALIAAMPTDLPRRPGRPVGTGKPLGPQGPRWAFRMQRHERIAAQMRDRASRELAKRVK